MEDKRLLQQYTEERSEAAFAELVNRYVDLVYSVALRKVGNPQDAEEVAQIVFCQLARKADRLPPGANVIGWLHQAACLQSLTHLRTERRRRERETEAARMHPADPDTESSWQQIAPYLDETLQQIEEQDRLIVLHRYFQGKSLREVGEQFGVTEDAARMRVNRALDKLRTLLAKRGIACSAVALAGLLSARLVQAAPAGVVQSVQAAVCISTAGASSLSGKLLSFAAKEKLLVAALALIAVCIMTGIVLHFGERPRPKTNVLEAESITPAATTEPAPIVTIPETPAVPIAVAPEASRNLQELIAHLRAVLHEEQVETNGVVSSERLVAAIKAFGPDISAAIPILMEGLRDTNDMVKMNSSWGFLRLGPQAAEATPLLLELARDESESIITRVRAIDSLRSLATHDQGAAVVATIVPEIEALLNDRIIWVRIEAMRVLGQLARSGPYAREAIPALTGMLAYSVTPEQARVERAAYLNNYTGTEEERLQKVTDKMTTELQRNAANELGCFGPDAHAAVPALAELLQRPDTWLRTSAARALKSIGPQAEPAAPALSKLLKDPDREMRTAAALALWKITGEIEAPATVLAETVFPVGDGREVASRVRVLGEMGSAAQVAVPTLVKLCKYRDPQIREAVLAALAKINPEVAATVPPLPEESPTATPTSR